MNTNLFQDTRSRQQELQQQADRERLTASAGGRGIESLLPGLLRLIQALTLRKDKRIISGQIAG